MGLAEQETLRRVAEERLRIAREVHDVVGHGLATITLRAGVADRLADRDPAEVRAALRAIRQVSKDSLAELGALLGVLRGDGEDAPGERAPAPDLRALPRLVDGLRHAGMDVALEVDDEDGAGGARGRRGRRLSHRAGGTDQRRAPRGRPTRARACASRGATAWSRSRCATTAAARPAPCGRAAGSSGCASGPPLLGGRFEAGGAPSGGFRVWASLPVGPRVTPRPARRRPGAACAPGFARAARRRGRPRGRGGGRRRRRGRRARPRDRGPTSCSWTSACPAWTGWRRTRRIVADPSWPASGCWSSPPSSSTSTSSRRCAPGPAASCSRTPTRTTSLRAVRGRGRGRVAALAVR